MSLKLIPYKNWDEWCDVYSLLFADDRRDVIRGLQKVEVFRKRTKLPSYMEETYNLLNELTFTQNSLSLSFTIVRMVNALTEKYKKKNPSMSLEAISQKMKLPSMFIDLRNSCTHKGLPGEKYVIDASKILLDWLKENCWDIQMNHIMRRRDNISVCLSSHIIKNVGNIDDLFHLNFEELAQFIPSELISIILNGDLNTEFTEDCHLKKVITFLDMVYQRLSLRFISKIAITELSRRMASGHSNAALVLQKIIECQICDDFIPTIYDILLFSSKDLLLKAIPGEIPECYREIFDDIDSDEKKFPDLPIGISPLYQGDLRLKGDEFIVLDCNVVSKIVIITKSKQAQP